MNARAKHLRSSKSLLGRTLGRVEVLDEGPFRHVPLYRALKDVLRRAAYRFRVLPAWRPPRWDRALLLNLTYWHAAEGGDVLPSPRVPADVVAHAAWHHLAARALAPRGAPSAAALFLGESIASAFDVYLVGRLLGRAPRSLFLQTQVPAMAEAARAAGMTGRAFHALLAHSASDPERAFEELRELLFDATTALFAARGADEAAAALARFERRRFGPLLHHYELSNWALYARAYGRKGKAERAVVELDTRLRAEPAPLTWLASVWLPA